MKHNVGGWEKWMRIGAGAAIAGLYFSNVIPRNKWGNAALGVAGELLGSGLLGYCPVKHALGHNSRIDSSFKKIMHNL